jgi:DNA primase
VSVCCPFHGDSHPSLLVYPDGFRCLACGRAGGAFDLYRALHGCTDDEAREALRNLQSAGTLPERQAVGALLPPAKLGERLHRNLTDAAMRYYLYERGLFPETVAEYQLGWGALYPDGPEGYTIPVYRDGRLRQVKLRLPDAEKNKYRSLAGCGTHLFLGDDVAWRDEVIIVEGEFDAIALRQYGFTACSSTGGVATFPERWLAGELVGSRLYVCPDNDERGLAGARRLRGLTRGRIGVIRLPEGVKDATDFFLANDTDDFRQLIRRADEALALR